MMFELWKVDKTKDIVYFLKETDENEELRYSLRSVEQNFPHKDIWFYGGCPNGIKPDLHVKCLQGTESKYLNVRTMLEQAIFNDDISDDFWLFNDDFFIMSPVAFVQPGIQGSLWRKIQQLETKYRKETAYSRKLKVTAYELKRLKKDRLNYELHYPMLINKKKAQKLLKEITSDIAFRSAYGNYYELGGVLIPDVKIFDTESLPHPDMHNVFLSTSDKSFAEGAVGEYIRRKFVDQCKYEQ